MIEITAYGVKDHGPSTALAGGMAGGGGATPSVRLATATGNSDSKKALAGISKRKKKPVS